MNPIIHKISASIHLSKKSFYFILKKKLNEFNTRIEIQKHIITQKI